MRTISLLAVVFLSASALLDNGCSAAAVDVHPAPHKVGELSTEGIRLYPVLGRRTLQRRAPQRGKEDDDRDDDRGDDRDDDRGDDRDDDRGKQNGKNRGKDSGEDGDAKGKDRGKNDDDEDDENEEGKGKQGDAAKNRNDRAKNAESAKGKTDPQLDDSADGADNADGTDNTDITDGNQDTTDIDSGDSSVYANGPAQVAVDNNSTKTVVVGACIGGVVLVGAGAVFFKVRQKKNQQTEAIVAKSATAFEQQSSVYEQQESDQAIGTFTVVSLFNPTLPDELEIQPGDKVTVLVEYDDGWVQAINESNDGQRGVMPRHCLDMNNDKFAVGKRSSSIGGFTSVNLN